MLNLTSPTDSGSTRVFDQTTEELSPLSGYNAQPFYGIIQNNGGGGSAVDFSLARVENATPDRVLIRGISSTEVGPARSVAGLIYFKKQDFYEDAAPSYRFDASSQLSLNVSSFNAGGGTGSLRVVREGIRWAQNHRAGRRGSIRFGHAFTDWWQKYAESNPDYFALPPDGLSETDLMKVVGNNGRHAKLRLSNPAVVEQIAKDYQKAGAPEYYNVCPNDGAGYDLAPETLAWDDPQGQDLQGIWKGDANLTARYVHFWNLISERLQQTNPEVTLLTYAYWSYRHPPKATQKFHGKAVIGMVDGWDAFEAWEGWRQAGAEIYLRPNWGSYYAGAPAIHAEEIVRFMHFAHENGMMGFDLDTIKGHWATEGFNSYVMARLMTQPDLTSDALVQEFSEAFGSAATKIREYLNYWQEKGTEFGYPIPAGGTTGANPGKYGELQAQGIISENYYHGPHAALPHLYTDSVLAPAKQLLEEAKALLTKEETQEAERVAFLQAGLKHHELMRNALALGIRLKEGKADSAELEKFRECANELDAFRKTTPFRHLAWPSIPRTENRFKSPIRPANISSAVQDTLTVD